MENIMIDFTANLELGQPQSHRNIDIVPLFLKNGAGPDYMMLREALDLGVVTVTEISEGGSVPELRLLNRGEKPVLILDGEELAGSKQNRVLNSSVLVKGKSETVIPVSCTEQGRWSYSSEVFLDSDVMMSKNLRSSKNMSVRRNLETGAGHRSDQGEVWNSILFQSANAGVHSKTGAMKDIHENRRAELQGYEEMFPVERGQKGLLAFINGRIIGLDVVSLESGYARVHAKLLRSYVLDAVLREQPKRQVQVISMAKLFVREISGCAAREFKSVSLGTDLRFESGSLFGSALEYHDTLIHTAVFSRADGTGNNEDRMARFNRRADFMRSRF